tara:strand:+ start:371 stop:2026 length:1656 start_codon:yes stop_codon:yes gene_type:complete
MADKVILEAEVKSNVGNVTKDVKNLDKATDKASGGFKGMGTAIKGVGTALKAAGIGLVVALLAKLGEVFMKNQKVVDAFNTTMVSLEIAFNDLFSFISDNVGAITGFFKELFENPKEKIIELGNAIKEGLVDRFNQALEVFGLVAKSFGQLIKGEFSAAFDTIKEAGKQTVDVFTGVDDSYEAVAKTITDYTKKTIDQAKAIVATTKAAERAAVEFAKLNAQYLKDAEIQRQIRDDETKTFEERIEANQKLDEILAEQQKAQKAQIQLQINAAQAQYSLNASEENYIALQEAKVGMLELEETITGQLSEQKTNQVALEKELLETQNELRVAGLSGIERELEELQNSYDLKLEMARKAGVDSTEITKQFEDEKQAIIKAAADEEEAQAKKVADEKIALERAVKDAKVNIAGQTLGLIGEIAGEGSKVAKAAAVAQATISGVQGVQNAFTTASASPITTVFPAYPFVQAGLAGAFSAMQIQKIMSGGSAGGSSGGGGGGGGGMEAQTPAPQMMSGAFQLGGGIEPEPTKAFVVTDEMTNSQNQLANIRRRATI